MKQKLPSAPLRILLADDDKDDRFFFSKALKDIPVLTQLETVEDGAELMTYLEKSVKLPDVLFLDLNMPRKNGMECLAEIKSNAKLKSLPVVIYSTSLNQDIADLLYKNGVHYYIRKVDLAELKKILFQIFTILVERKFAVPSRSEFIINLIEI